MHHSYRHIASQPLHFKKWSNTSYAVFNSIGRIIHIGFLSNIIHGLKTVKASISHEILRLFDLNNIGEFDENILAQQDPLALMYNEEMIACDFCDQSIPSHKYVSEEIIYTVYNILERPLFGPFFHLLELPISFDF